MEANLDVRNEDQWRELVNKVLEKWGVIDILSTNYHLQVSLVFSC